MTMQSIFLSLTSMSNAYFFIQFLILQYAYFSLDFIVNE